MTLILQNDSYIKNHWKTPPPATIQHASKFTYVLKAYLVVLQTPQVSGDLELDVDVQTALSDVAS